MLCFDLIKYDWQDFNWFSINDALVTGEGNSKSSDLFAVPPVKLPLSRFISRPFSARLTLPLSLHDPHEGGLLARQMYDRKA